MNYLLIIGAFLSLPACTHYFRIDEEAIELEELVIEGKTCLCMERLNKKKQEGHHESGN